MPARPNHGRDLFAPTAGWLAQGGPGEEVGPVLTSLTPLEVPEPHEPDPYTITGEVVHIDGFGNARTNIARWRIRDMDQAKVRAAFRNVGPIRGTYSDVAAGEALALIGSTDYLEIAVRNGSAAEVLGLGLGNPVRVRRE